MEDRVGALLMVPVLLALQWRSQLCDGGRLKGRARHEAAEPLKEKEVPWRKRGE